MTRYFFAPETGNDANSGLVSGSPKRSTSAAGALVLAGNQISWRCGEKVTFGSGSAGWAMSNKTLASECLIDFYDDDVFAQKPLFDAMTYLVAGVDDSNWTSLGDGRWARNFSGEVNRMFAGTTEANIRAGTIGAPFGYVSAAGNVSSTSKWHMLTSAPYTVTLYTGSTSIAPPTFFDSLACVGNGIATVEGIKISRCTNVRLEGLQVWGGQRAGFSTLAESGATGSLITFVDCESHATGRSGNGLRISNTTVPTLELTNILVTRHLSDAHSTSQEDDDTSSRWGSQNGIAVEGAVNGVEIVDPIIKGGYRHSYIQAQCNGQASKLFCRNVIVRLTNAGAGYIDCADSEYGHGFDIDAVDYTIDDIEVRNQIGRSQFAGTGTITGVFWKAPRLATQSSNLNTEQCAWVQNWSSPDYRRVTDITFEACRFDNCHNDAIELLEDRSAAAISSEAGFATNAVKINACVFCDLTNVGSRTHTVDHQVQGTPFLNSGLLMTNNIFITALASPLRRETTAGGQTSYGINEYAGSSGNVQYGSLAEAGLGADLLPPPPVGTFPRSAKLGRKR